MRSQDIRKMVSESVTQEHRIVKWWRKENDFVDYDLIDRFLENLSPGDEIGGVELLTMGDMLNEVQRVSGNRVSIVHDETGDSIRWVHEGKSGKHTNKCTLTPESLLRIFDVETRGNAVY